jgi:hypothetical protein
MKRAIVAILTGILLLAGIQPTVVFHFCQGNLHSVGMGEVPPSCCMAEGEKEAAAMGFSLSETTGSCCSNLTVELSTDNFRTPDVISTAGSPTENIVPLPYFLPAAMHCTANPYLLLYTQAAHPPEHAAGDSPIDILSLHCILRI